MSLIGTGPNIFYIEKNNPGKKLGKKNVNFYFENDVVNEQSVISVPALL